MKCRIRHKWRVIALFFAFSLYRQYGGKFGCIVKASYGRPADAADGRVADCAKLSSPRLVVGSDDRDETDDGKANSIGNEFLSFSDADNFSDEWR